MKKALSIVLALIIVLSLSACHGNVSRASFVPPEEFDTSRHFELSFWAKNDTNKYQTAIYQKAIDDFQALYPNIEVNLRLYTDYGRIYQDVITNISTNTTPNICITYPDHIATYKTGSEVVVPLDELMVNSKYGLGGSEVRFDAPKMDEIVPQFLSECYIDGICYALPFMRSTEACYVNKTLVEKLGYTLPDMLTWDFVWEVSEKAMEKDADGVFKVNGQKVMIPFIYKSTDNMMISMLRQKGADYSTAAGEVLIFNDTTRSLLLEIAEHAGTRAFSTFKISSYPGNFLNAGQCIFAVDSTAGATWMGTDAPNIDIPKENLVDFETVVMEIPQYDTAHPQMMSQGPSACIFNKEDPQEVLASWLFLQYLITNDVQIAYSETEGYLPVTLKAQSDPSYVDYLSLRGSDVDHYYVKIDAAKLLQTHTADTFTTPVFNGSASLRDAAGQMIEEVTKGMRRGKTVDDQFIDDLYADMTSLYRLDSIEAGQSTELQPLPTESKVLLGALVVVWLGIGAIYLARIIRKRENS